jgi:heptosyltransferase-2
MTKTPRDRPRKIVVVAPNWLGDAVMSLPAVATLSAAPGTVVAVSCRAYTARVFAGLEGVAELWVDAAGGRPRTAWTRARALRRYGADATVVLPPSFSSALPGWLSGVRHRAGFRADARSWMLTCAVRMPGRDVHLTRAYRDLASAALARLGLREGGPASPPRLRASGAEREAAERLLRAAAPGGDYVVVVPGAAFGPAKAWVWERYRELCGRLGRERTVVVAGSAGDRGVCERVCAGLHGVVNLAGRTGLGEFFALVEGARVLVANDSGAPHVAAAMGVPVVVLFGSTSPAWTAPLGPRVEVLQHRVHCNPCFRRTCPTRLECFNGIEVEAVHGAVARALAPGGEKPVVGGPAGRVESSPDSRLRIDGGSA